MTKHDVAAALDDIGTLLALKGENEFRTRAYHTAARTLAALDRDLGQLVRDNKLGDVPGIGDALRDKITTLVTTGRLPYLDELRASVPAGMVDMLRIPGLGVKKVIALHTALGVETLAALQAACERDEVAGLKGFGAKTQAKVLAGIQFLGTVGNRVTFARAYPLGLALLERLRTVPGVTRAELCGSLRRRRETAKDMDIVVATADPAGVMAAFVGFPEVTQVVAHGPSKSSVVAELPVGHERVMLGADLRAVSDEQFPVAVLHFTGSQAHNIRLRQRAIERDMILNEYALTRAAGPVPVREEADVYRALGMEWVPPELREDTGEVEAAENNTLPALVRVENLRGVFHNHSTASDGKATLAEMAAAARKLGWEYFGLGDHSQSLTVANGLTPARVRAQWAEVDALNKQFTGFRVFKGTECDILKDGSLDFPDDLLAGFDYIVVSVHNHFDLPEAEQTARVCQALAHPATTMLGHATGRLLLRREGYKIDVEEVLQAAARHGKMVEINAQPDRLDLDWTHCKRAKQLGVSICINPDAHSPGELTHVQYGINVARRGWLSAADVFNTRGLADVMRELDPRKGR